MPTIRKGQLIGQVRKSRIPDMTAEERAAIDRRVPAAQAWRHSEHSLQCTLVAEMNVRAAQVPELRQLYAVPNAGARRRGAAGRLKAEGMRAGVPDIVIAAAVGGFHGLYLELKAQKGSPTDAQWEWLLTLHRGGYAAFVANDLNTARQLIFSYLEP